MQNIFKIFRLSRPLHGWIVVAAVLITVLVALQQVTPIALKFVVDELTAQASGSGGSYDRLLWLFGIILSVNLLVVLLNGVTQRLGDFIASRLGKYLTEVYYRTVLMLPQRHFDSEISGKMVNQLNRGIVSIREFVNEASNFIVPALLQAVFGIAVLSYFNLTIGLLALAVFPLYIAISSYSTKIWGRLQAKKNIHEDAARGRIQEAISNMKLVKTYNTQESEWQFVSKEYAVLNKLYDSQSTQYHLLNFARGLGLEIAFIGILYLVFQRTFSGAFSLGDMVLIIQLVNQLRWPLFGMSYMLEQVQRAEADSKEFFQVLGLPSQERRETAEAKKQLAHPKLEFTDVSFAYENKQVLKQINLKFDRRETVALVGHSGAGKTTLVNLILKLYEPTRGEISLSGIPYSTANHAWVRAHTALVFQDTELFSSTVRENVAYGVPHATDADITQALKQANAYEFVSELEGKLDAQIGERGVKLSGGQKQRIQIARAILHDKPILILDEATSSLDAKSERYVQDALEKLFKNRLVIIIAHRFSTIQNVDRIIVLEKGTVADVGTPKELAKRDGLYAELLRYQVEGNKKLLNKFELY